MSQSISQSMFYVCSQECDITHTHARTHNKPKQNTNTNKQKLQLNTVMRTDESKLPHDTDQFKMRPVNTWPQILPWRLSSCGTPFPRPWPKGQRLHGACRSRWPTGSSHGPPHAQRHNPSTWRSEIQTDFSYIKRARARTHT